MLRRRGRGGEECVGHCYGYVEDSPAWKGVCCVCSEAIRIASLGKIYITMKTLQNADIIYTHKCNQQGKNIEKYLILGL